MKNTDEIALDLFDLLSAEHQVLADLMGRIAELLDLTSYAEAADHFAVFRVAFELHSAAEEEAIYAVLADGPPALEALVRDAQHHHALATIHIDRLSRMDVSLPEWPTYYASLTELIQSHVELEEGAMRAVAADEVTSDLSAELARDYLESKRRFANLVDGAFESSQEA